MARSRGGAQRSHVRVDFEEMVIDPLFDIDDGVYLDADRLPLSETSKERLRDLQRRWMQANDLHMAGGAIDAPVDAAFDADLKDVELRVRRELAGTSWSLVRIGRRKDPARSHRR